MASMRSRIWRQVLLFKRDWSLPLVELRRKADEDGSRIGPPADVEVQSLQHFGIAGEWLIPRDAAPAHCMLYLHGGGYVMGSVRSHRALAARIARAAGIRVFLLDYRLAPESPFPAALQDALGACRWLTQQGFRPRNIAIAGDGSGGGLALAACIALRDAGEPLPGRIACISPWLDLTCSGESILAKARVDPWITTEALQLRHLYAPLRHLGEPLLSPLFADLAGLPSMLVHVGSDEMLASDSHRLADKAAIANVKVRLKEWPGMWHVFHALAPQVPEADAAISDIGAFIRAWKAPWRGEADALAPLAPALVANP
jgi:monoterpene epsilon-lactone hydrolase